MLGFLTAIGLFIILMTLLFWYLNNKLALENAGSLQCLDDFRKKAESPGECWCSFYVSFILLLRTVFQCLDHSRQIKAVLVSKTIFLQIPPQSSSLALLSAFEPDIRDFLLYNRKVAWIQHKRWTLHGGVFTQSTWGSLLLTHVHFFTCQLPQNFKMLVSSGSLHRDLL